MKLITTLNPENVRGEEINNFRERTTVRAVVYDLDGNIGVLNVKKQNYYKLPGGGKEEGESDHEALKRECLEELGCDVEILGEVGKIIEYRKIFNMKQTAICYLAKVIGEKRRPSFTKDEIENEFEIEWIPAEKAISVLDLAKPLNAEGKLYIVPREVFFLKEVFENKNY